MKKLFTSLALAAIAICNLSANAEKATIYVKGYYTGIEAEVETEIVRLEDGSYSIPDFLGSGAPFSFSFTKPTESMKKDSNIKITSPCYEEIDEEYGIDAWYLTNAEEEDLECEFTSDGKTYYMISPSVYLDDQTYVVWSESGAIKSGWTGKNYNYEYLLSLSGDGYISTNADVADEDFDYTYIDIYFDGMSTPAQPAKIFMTTCNYETYEYKDVVIDTEIVKLEDGSYSIPDFLNSGAPFSFSIVRPSESMEKGTDVKFTSNTEYDADYAAYYLLTPEDDYMECEYELDGTKHYLFDPSVYNPSIQWSETGKIKMSGTNYDYEYVLSLDADGYIVTDPNAELGYSDFHYIWYDILFNGIGDDPIEEPNEPVEPAGEGEEITVYIEDYDGNAVADPFVTTLIPNTDGSYTIADVMNSGEPLSFKFTPIVDDWADMEITSPLDHSDYYPYLLNPDGSDFLYCTLYGYNGKEGATELDFPFIYPAGCAVYGYDTTNPENTYKYYGTICTSGFLGNDQADWFYLDFYFGKTEGLGVKTLENSNAPVEFYNLNGVRVQNPSNGIFIRKQGSDVKKVVIK